MSSSNKNMLSPVGFSLVIKRLPEMTEFVQSVTLPGINLGSIDRPTPFKSLPVYGDHVTYGDMSITFKINEDLDNYIEVFNWMTSIGFPDDHTQHKTLADADQTTGQGIYSDGTLVILSSAMNQLVKVNIHDMFPIDLSDITFDTQDTGIEYITATASFRFKNYYFIK